MSANPLLRVLFLLSVVLFGTECIAADGVTVDVRSANTPNGIRYWYLKEHNLPIVSVAIAFKKAGSAYDPEGQHGLSYLASLVMPHSEVEEGASALKKLTERGIDLSVSIDRENVYIFLKTLSDNLGLALEMLGRCLLDTRIDAGVFAQEKEHQKSAVRHSATEPSELAMHGIGRVLFGDHPYGRSPRGNTEDIDKITLDDISRYKRETFDLDQIVIGVVGDVNEKTLSQMLDTSFARLSRGQNLKEVSPVDANIGSRGYIEYDAPQSVVMFAGQGVKITDRRYHAMQLLTNALGGTALNSVLMRELREKLGITYRVGSFLHNEGHMNLMLGVLYTDNSTAKRGVDGLADAIKKVKAYGLDERAFNISKADILDSFVFTFLNTGSVADLLMRLQLQGRELGYISEYHALFDSITLQEVNEVAREVLGDLSVVEVGVRNNIGGRSVL
ncbi:peptidase M16 [Anaplasma ovis str. Haibei]|uniref:Peptidase M16 n=1 Tax=Anaplasma ovis str. Haibei TaxID=1248439 RepID=A0A2Z2L8H8_9RICK|nr:pitrilysin family protein [Anaplasma ovis]ASI47944.1 peptidase M16 [Anaplasma ovis str. Haibei]